LLIQNLARLGVYLNWSMDWDAGGGGVEGWGSNRFLRMPVGVAVGVAVGLSIALCSCELVKSLESSCDGSDTADKQNYSRD
jgi:hypothetical protein